MPATPWLAYACLGASMALVGSYVALSKVLVVVFPVLLLAWLRFGIGAVAMVGWVRRPALEAPLTRHDRGLLFLQSLLGNFLFSLCMLYGIALSSALAAGVIMAALPAVVALLSWLALRERLTAPVLGGIACAVSGIALVSIEGRGAESAGTLWGNLLLVAAVFCEASYVVIGKRLSATLSPRRISALINLWGLALATPLGLWAATRFDFSAVDTNSWSLLVFYALAASVVSVWLWMTGLRSVPATQAGVFTVMLPVSAALVGVIWLGETFSAAQAAAFALALTGIVLATRSPRLKTPGPR